LEGEGDLHRSGENMLPSGMLEAGMAQIHVPCAFVGISIII
jgi:hypothetical protein